MYSQWISGAIGITALLSTSIANAGPETDPKWYVTAKLGLYQPSYEQTIDGKKQGWEDFYGDSASPSFALGLNYQPWRTLSFGVNVQMIQDHGEGFAVLNQKSTGRSDIELYPASLEATWHGHFIEKQLVIPYAAIGWMRMGYKGSVRGNDNVVKGTVDGSLWRVGLQWQLDQYDKRSAKYAYQSYGIDRTYLLLEYANVTAEETNGDVDVDLGGSGSSIGVSVGF